MTATGTTGAGEAKERAEANPRADTRSHVLEIAARHFAHHGYGATSLRAVQREAGVNPATVHYHFGSKEALYRAVIEQSLESIQSDRLARLAGIPPGLPARERLHALLHAYLAPHLEHATTRTGHHYAQILAFVQVNPRDAATDMFDTAVAPVRQQFADALAALFPQAKRGQLLGALSMAVANMAMMPIGLGDRSFDRASMAAAIDTCVNYTGAGFEKVCGPIAEPA